MAGKPAWAETYGEVTQRVGGNANTEIVDIFKRSLEIEREKNDEERAAQGKALKQNPWVTDAGKCHRKTWFSLRNEEPTHPLTTQSLVNFKVGHAVEEAFASVLDHLGGSVVREVSVRIPAKGTVVSGRVDFLVTIPGFDSLIELKSTSSISMKLTLQGLERGEYQATHENYKKQLNQYLHASQMMLLEHETEDGRRLMPVYRTGYLLYVIKDAKKGQEPIQAFKVEYDEKMARADVDNLAEIKAMADRNVDPGIPLELSSFYESKKKLHWSCGYCDFRGKCWGVK